MATSVSLPDQSVFPASADDSSRRGKRKRNNEFDHPDAPPSRRQASRNQYQAPSPHMASSTSGAPSDDPSSLNSHNMLSGGPSHHDEPHPSNNQFDIASLNDHNAHASAAVHNQAAVVAAGQATAAAALHQDFNMQVPPHPGSGFGEMPTGGQTDDFGLPPDGQSVNDANPTQQPSKPTVGSEEWHKVRKDNHKEVERRRRETINEGINELAKIVPGCEKNKGSILARAVQYIQKLQEDANTNIDKWTFEKLVTEQAINELSEKVSKAYREKEAWKRLAKEAGADVDSVDLGLGHDTDHTGAVDGSLDDGTGDADHKAAEQA